MAVHLKDVILFVSFTIMYIFLGFIVVPIPTPIGIYVSIWLFEVLIPLSIIFGWPAILGLTAGSLLYFFQFSIGFFPLADLLIVFGTFLASFLAMKIGRLKTSFGVNVIAIIGALLALIALLMPWWGVDVWILEQKLGDFTVYPGWFGGDLGVFAELIRRIVQIVVTDPFGQIMNSLELTLWLVVGSSLLSLVGAFLRDRKGRVIVVLGAATGSVGIFNFYNSLSQSMSSLPLPVSGSASIEWLGTTLAQATWGWTAGIYLSLVAAVLLAIAVVLHSHMLQIEPSRFLGCAAATVTVAVTGELSGMVVTSLLWPHVSIPTTYRLGYLIIRLFASFVTINIVGYAIISIIGKRRREE